MARLFKYFLFLLVSAKLVQGVRSAFGSNGVVPQLVATAHVSIQKRVRSAIFVSTGFAFLLIGSLYMLFHCAAEWDNLGYFTFNAQKTISAGLMVIGLILIYPARAVLRRPPQLFANGGRDENSTVDPAHQMPSPQNKNAQKIHEFVRFMNGEANKFLDQATRPKNAVPIRRKEPRPPTLERTLE